MITGPLKSKIDKLWEEFWTGGITNPLTVIEQITFLMYARLLDMNETSDEKRSQRTKKEFNRRFNDKQQHIRWSNLVHIESADKLMATVKDELFPYFKQSAQGQEGSLFAEFMKDAQLMVQKPSLLVKAIEMVNDLPLDKTDTKGDLYEYLLSKLTTAGINGQFRTPRHIIRAIIDMVDPSATDRICDPACGTAGFLSTTYEFMLEKYSSSEGIHREPVYVDGDEDGEPLLDINGKPIENILYTGDLLGKNRKHIDTDMFHGFDFDATMLRIAAMNLVMHGVAQPDIHYQDTLSQRFSERFPQEAQEGFDVILANPPFKGSLDEEDVSPDLLRTVKTKKTELLFTALILRMLKVGGRAAVIVPDGVLFSSSKAHQQLRQELVENNQIEGIVSLPNGIFKPYAGVSTAILFFTKGGETDRVWFYDLENDGFTLDDKRTELKATLKDKNGEGNNDLPHVIAQWKKLNKIREAGTAASIQKKLEKQFGDKTQKAFIVSKQDIADNKYDLSINRYKEVVYTEEIYETPNVLLGKLKSLESGILKDLNELEKML
jgi:type I restriction enzyme M protein